MSFHWDMVDGWWPSDAVAYREPRSWLPRASRCAFRDLVDHLSRRLLHRPSTKALLQGLLPGRRARARRPDQPRSTTLSRGSWPRLVATILDSPAFYQR